MNRDLGADPAQLEELGRRFDIGAQSLSGLGDGVSGQLSCMEWFGPDADRFRNEWETHHRGRFYALSEVLREMAGVLWRQAEQQRHASAREGGLGPGSAYPGSAYPGGTMSPRLPDLGSLLHFSLFGLDVADLAGNFKDLPKLLAGQIPEDLLKLTKHLPVAGDLIGVLVDWNEQDNLGVALGVTGIALTGLAVGAAIVGAPGIAGAAVVVGTGLAIVELARDAPEIISTAGALIGPVVNEVAKPIGQAVGAVVDVAAPVVEGVKDFAGDVWDEAGKAWDRFF